MTGWALFAVIASVVFSLVVLIISPLFGNVRISRYQSPFPDQERFDFPEGFLWGASTAAQQIESQQNTDWTAFEKKALAEKKFEQLGVGMAKPGHIHHLGDYPAEVIEKKTDYDQRFVEDLAQAAAMKHNAYRFSLCWARLFPKEDQKEADKEGMLYYEKIFDQLASLGIKPSVTLFHFSSPAWLWEEKGGKRGWEREDALGHFERFVKAVAERFGGRVEHWCTLNEPMVFLYNGYLEGLFPPNERRDGGPVAIAHLAVRMLEAHTLAYDILKEDAKKRGKTIEVGIAKHTRAFEPYRNYAPLDRLAAQFAEQAFVWDFLDAMQTGEYKMTATSFRREIPGLKGKMDYVGINYYGRFYLKSPIWNPANFTILPHDPSDPNELISELGWSLYPHGFFNVLQKAHTSYQLPIYILENGIDCRPLQDTLRQHFLVTHLREVWNAIHHAGADIRGYFQWSLIDNFEWAEGFGPRFGLLHVDYEKDFQRTPRESAALFSQIIESNALTQEIWETHHDRQKNKTHA
ncbi:MAG: glycoside hydrolase family 1 protein [Myxococcales bacterium]|nr:glycoside hydrolase family 1 protein [Myxococcales bacterium]